MYRLGNLSPRQALTVMKSSCMLDREEYVEQGYFFQVLSERLPKNVALQDLLGQIRDEVLATTKLPFAIDFLLAELNHSGVVSTAMARIAHYFTPFQTYIMQEAESEHGRFDIRIAVDVLRQEAEYRAGEATPVGIFLYQFETLSRNRLKYDAGLKAIAHDPCFDEDWKNWILRVRHDIGIVDFADMVYVASAHYVQQQNRRHGEYVSRHTILFGEKEGRIALANRNKDPLYFFSALQRHLGYPTVPRPKPQVDVGDMIPQMARRLERLEARLKLLEEEQRHDAIDLTKFYGNPLQRPQGGD